MKESREPTEKPYNNNYNKKSTHFMHVRSSKAMERRKGKEAKKAARAALKHHQAMQQLQHLNQQEKNLSSPRGGNAGGGGGFPQEQGAHSGSALSSAGVVSVPFDE